jgi:hypothetical protein
VTAAPTAERAEPPTVRAARTEAALDWNELSLGFYRSVGAQTMDEWITHVLRGEELTRLAGESAGPSGMGGSTGERR